VITRNAVYAKRLGSFKGLTALLVDSADEEAKRLERSRESLLAAAEIIPLTAAGPLTSPDPDSDVPIDGSSFRHQS